MIFYSAIPPAVIAIAIFVYMGNRQAHRNDKLRKRYTKRRDALMQMLANQPENKNETDDN